MPFLYVKVVLGVTGELAVVTSCFRLIDLLVLVSCGVYYLFVMSLSAKASVVKSFELKLA